MQGAPGQKQNLTQSLDRWGSATEERETQAREGRHGPATPPEGLSLYQNSCSHPVQRERIWG